MKRAVIPALVCALLAIVSVRSLIHGHASFILWMPFAWMAFEKTTEIINPKKK